MTTWNEYVEKSGTVPEWPYPIRYDKENEISDRRPDPGRWGRRLSRIH